MFNFSLLFWYENFILLLNRSGYSKRVFEKKFPFFYFKICVTKKWKAYKSCSVIKYFLVPTFLFCLPLLILNVSTAPSLDFLSELTSHRLFFPEFLKSMFLKERSENKVTMFVSFRTKVVGKELRSFWKILGNV